MKSDNQNETDFNLGETNKQASKQTAKSKINFCSVGCFQYSSNLQTLQGQSVLVAWGTLCLFSSETHFQVHRPVKMQIQIPAAQGCQSGSSQASAYVWKKNYEQNPNPQLAALAEAASDDGTEREMLLPVPLWTTFSNYCFVCFLNCLVKLSNN